MSEKKTYGASYIFRAERGFGPEDMKAMNAPCTVTPEKLRNLARIVALADKMDDLSQENLVVHLRAAADEIERLQARKLPDAFVTRHELTDEEWSQEKRNQITRLVAEIIGVSEMDKEGKVGSIMIDTPNGPKPISEMKDGDVYEGGIWYIKP